MIGIYSEGAYSEGLVVRRDSGIETPGDLKGKRIGYFAGSSAHYGLIMTLRQHGISRDQVNLLDMPPEEQLVALMNKDLDAAMVWEPGFRKWFTKRERETRCNRGRPRHLHERGGHQCPTRVAPDTGRRPCASSGR